jgi:two-component system cell cycle response regulator
VNATIRGEDVLARVGGEEFVVLLRDITREGALDCAERLRSSVERTVFEAEGVRIPVTVSIGVATLTGTVHANSSDLLQAADRALYEAKRTGRNRVCPA